jgi:adenine deaminase
MLNNAYLQLSLLALVVISELRISDRGIVDMRRFRVVGLIVE